MLTEDGVRILDFGLATFADALKLDSRAPTPGRRRICRRNRCKRPAPMRADVWAVGVILYEMRNETAAWIRATRPDVGEDAEQLVFRAMHKDLVDTLRKRTRPGARAATGPRAVDAAGSGGGTEGSGAPHPPVSKVRRLPRWKIATGPSSAYRSAGGHHVVAAGRRRPRQPLSGLPGKQERRRIPTRSLSAARHRIRRGPPGGAPRFRSA